MKPKFDRLILFGRKLIDSGRIQNSESFAGDLQEVEHQWQLVNDNITASCEALSQVRVYLCVRVCMCVYVCVSVCMCVYLCVYLCVHLIALGTQGLD